MNGLLFWNADDDAELDSGYKDPLVTAEQKHRDVQITALLSEYVKSYQKKVRHMSACRYIILIPCILIICLFAVLLICFSTQIMGAQSQLEIPECSFIYYCLHFVHYTYHGIIDGHYKIFLPRK